MVGNGLNTSVLGVRSQAEGFGLTVTGVIMAAYFAGFLAGTVSAERMLRSVGHIRVFAALASTASSAVLIHAVAAEPVAWALMRFVFGACMAGLYVVVESWLNDLATNATRGRILSVYMIVSMGGIGVGQLMLNVADPAGFRLFVVASVLVSMSLVPVTLSARSSPPVAVPEPMPLRRLLSIAPTGVVGVFWVGASLGALMGMGAVYAAAAGMSQSRISVFLVAPFVGAILFQWPIGRLADRLPRRGVIVAVGAVAVAASAVPLFVPDGSMVAVLAVGVVGGTYFPLYSLVVAYTNDWLTPSQMLGASATLVRVNGAGSIVGPLGAAVVMHVAGTHAYFFALAAAGVPVVVYVLYRIVAVDGLPVERQRRVLPLSARATAVAAMLGTRRRTDDAERPGAAGGPPNDR